MEGKLTEGYTREQGQWFIGLTFGPMRASYRICNFECHLLALISVLVHWTYWQCIKTLVLGSSSMPAQSKKSYDVTWWDAFSAILRFQLKFGPCLAGKEQLCIETIRNLYLLDSAARDSMWVTSSSKIEDLKTDLRKFVNSTDEEKLQSVETIAAQVRSILEDAEYERAEDLWAQVNVSKRYEKATQRWLQNLKDFEPLAFNHFIYVIIQSLYTNISTYAWARKVRTHTFNLIRLCLQIHKYSVQ